MRTLRLASFALLLVACAGERPTAPGVVGQGTAAELHPMAFTADINTRTRTISIRPPATASAGARAVTGMAAGGPNLSLLAGDVVRMVTSNYRESAVGAFTPNKIRITFDVVIQNRLPGIRLITPTWPVAPASGVILFPVSYAVTVAPGSVIGGEGTTLVVQQPRFGAVSPSPDFDGTGAPGSGAPYNFFNDADCSAATSDDCFRWKAFDASIAPLGASGRRTIGFDIDPSVAQFRALLIVAADLAPSAGAISPRTTNGEIKGSGIKGSEILIRPDQDL